MKRFLSNWPYFFLLFPVFFVLHQVAGNYLFISAFSAVKVTIIYISVATMLTGLFYLLSKNLLAAALTATFILFIQFFFGNIQDFLKTIAGNGLLTRYSFLILLFTLLGIFLFLWLKRKKNLSRFTLYLNSLLLLLILIDIIVLVAKFTGKPKTTAAKFPVVRCDSCSRPDIYIILLDGYAGTEQLRQGFGFDNSPFLAELTNKGFTVLPGTTSNYLFTPYSIASIMNMEYMDAEKINGSREKGSNYTLRRLDDNNLQHVLRSLGYRFYNYSIFRMGTIDPAVESMLVAANANLINENTFTARLEKHVLPNLAVKWGFERYLHKYMYKTHDDNERLYSLLVESLSRSSQQPKAVFTHLMMPHDPYYLDSNGRLRTFRELDSIGIRDKPAFLEQLKYTNRKIVALADRILLTSPQPPIIVLLSDHGFRYDYANPVNLAFSNLTAIYIPGKVKMPMPYPASAINVFPWLLNGKFSQQLPYHKDSTFTFGF